VAERACARVKKRAYAEAKKDIKSLMLVAKHRSANLEEKLLELNMHNELYRSRFTNADKLYMLLSALYDQYGLMSRLSDPSDTELEPEVIYMHPSEIDEGFDDEQNQLRPLKLFIKTSSDVLVQQFESVASHHSVILDSVDEAGVTHISLSFKEE
jgi:hypothetical protein